MSVGRPAALSHTTALRQWTILDGALDAPINISVPASRCVRPQGALLVHRRAPMPPVVRVNGLPTVDLPYALIGSWPLLPSADRRAPVIAAVRRRLLEPVGLRAAIDATTRLAGRAALCELVDLLAAGCESELP